MLDRLEAPWVRERVKSALREAGINIWGTPLEDAVTSLAVLLLLEDRGTSARLVHEAVNAYGDLDQDQARRLADVIQFRHEPEQGEIIVRFHDGTEL